MCEIALHKPSTEIIHGIFVRDPYRWLEYRKLADTEAWIRQQQTCCNRYISQCHHIESIRSRVAEYLDRSFVDQPVRVGDRYFFRRRDRGQEQPCLYVCDDELERRLVDPALAGRFNSVGIYSVSRNGRWLAYETKIGGEDLSSVHLLDVETGEDPVSVTDRGYKRGFIFSALGDGFFYCHDVPGSKKGHLVFHHSFASASTEIVFQAPCSGGSRVLLIGNEIYLGAILIHEVDGQFVEDLYVARQKRPHQWQQALSRRSLPCDAFFQEERLLVVTPNGDGDRLSEISLLDGRERVLISSEETPLREVLCGSNIICATVRQGQKSRVRCWTLQGESRPDLPAPDEGFLRLLPNLGDRRSLFFSHTTLVRPPTLLEYRCESKQLSPWQKASDLSANWKCLVDSTHYVARDGTSIPITLLSSSPRRHGERPAVMTGYGGFGVTLTPQYSVLARVLLEFGITLVFPHVRGGGEFGRSWHEAARKSRRGVAIRDFLDAARWLCDVGVTAPERLAIMGGSNGGLLVAAAMVQDPNLFRAVVSIAPLLDMVRYEDLAYGRRWREEFGSACNPEDFNALYSYSPYHHVADDIDYPAMLFVTGDRDDRCNPAHVRKMAARLQERSAQHRPIVVDYHDERGHAPTMPFSTRVESIAIRIAFLCQELGIQPRWEAGS